MSFGGGHGGGQSFEDKLQALKCFISGQAISLVVLKATTSELIGPKRKHLNYLLSMTNESNVSIPNLTKYLMQRARHPDWSVAFKSLITIHHLMSYGNERFIQNLASSSNVNNRSFAQLASYVDRSSNQAYDMSTFLRRYSLYINAKINTYRSLGLDFCRLIIANNGDHNHHHKSNLKSIEQTQLTSTTCRLRDMPLEQLMTTLPILQDQFDSLIAFDASPNDLNNGIINTAFASLFKDFVKLYMAYQTIILRLLELYFMVGQLKRAQELYDAYRRFLVRMDKVSDFMRTIDSVGMDKSDLPKMSKAPSLSLQLLEDRLKQLDPLTNSKRTTSDQAARWKPIELPPIQSLITTNSTRRRGSLLLPHNQNRAASAIGHLDTATTRGSSSNAPVEVPRLKSPQVPRKHRNRNIKPDQVAATSAAAAAAADATNEAKDFSWTANAIDPFRKLQDDADRSIGLITTTLVENGKTITNSTQSSAANERKPSPPSDLDTRQERGPDKLDEFDLLLDADEQQPSPPPSQPELELIILNHGDKVQCSKAGEGTKETKQSPLIGNIDGYQQPSDWVQV